MAKKSKGPDFAGEARLYLKEMGNFQLLSREGSGFELSDDLLTFANYSDADPGLKTRPNVVIRIFELSL
jgi:hypothetical protein